MLAFFVYKTKNQVSTQTRANIQLCLPQLSANHQEDLIFESIHQTSCAFFELAVLWYQPIEKVLNLIKTKNIDNSFYDNDKSKIIIAPHQGSWELLNLWLANEGTTYSLYKPAKSSSMDHYILSKRTRNNAVLIPANTTGLRKLLIGLKNKASCMILPDQRPAKNTAQINAMFFNKPAQTSLLIKRIAQKIDSNIYIATVTRNLTTSDFELTVKALSRSEFLTEDLDSANYLNKSIENLIQNNYAQYQWAYRRFSKNLYKK